MIICCMYIHAHIYAHHLYRSSVRLPLCPLVLVLGRFNLDHRASNISCLVTRLTEGLSINLPVAKGFAFLGQWRPWQEKFAQICNTTITSCIQRILDVYFIILIYYVSNYSPQFALALLARNSSVLQLRSINQTGLYFPASISQNGENGECKGLAR
jgi:hypothetical protein